MVRKQSRERTGANNRFVDPGMAAVPVAGPPVAGPEEQEEDADEAPEESDARCAFREFTTRPQPNLNYFHHTSDLTPAHARPL